MRIEAVHALAFGPLTDATMELAPGLTVVWGPNEAGKSTWLAAAYAGLCGLRRRSGPHRFTQEFRERHQPWSQGGWTVGTVIALSDGRRLRLHHDLVNRDRSQVTESDTGVDLTGDLEHDGAPDGSVLLGLTRDMVWRTILVRQADMLACTEGSGELRQALQRAASTTRTDATADEAIERIERFRGEVVGTERAPTRPLRQAMATVDAARDALADAQRQHDAYVGLLADRDAAAATMGAAAAERERLRIEGERRSVAALESRLAEAEALADRAGEDQPGDSETDEDLATEAGSALATWQARPPAPSAHDGPDAATLRRQLDALPPAPVGDTEPAPEVDAAARDLEYARRDLERVWRERLPESSAAPVDTDPTSLRQTADALEREPPTPDPDLAERVVELERQHGRVRQLRTSTGVAAAVTGALALMALGAGQGGLALLAALSAGALAFVAAASGRNLDRGALEDARAQQAAERARTGEVAGARQQAEQRCAEWDAPADPALLRELADAVEHARDAERQQRRWHAELQRAIDSVEDADAALRHRLSERTADAHAGDGTSGSVPAEATGSAAAAPCDAADSSADAHIRVLLDRVAATLAAVEAYRRACRERAEQAVAAARAPDLQAQLRARERAERDAADARRRRVEATVRLVAVATAVAGRAEDGGAVAEQLSAAPALPGGGGSADAQPSADPMAVPDEAAAVVDRREGELDGLAEALQTWRAGHQARRQDREDRRRAHERLTRLLDGGDLDALRSDVARRRAVLDAQLADIDLGDLADLGDEELHARLERAEQEHARARDELAQRRGEVAQYERSMPSVTDAEEDLAHAEAELARLRALDATLGRALRHLRQASERVNRDVAPRLRQTVERWLPELTGGRYAEVGVDPESLSVSVSVRDGSVRPAWQLSHGTTEQVYLLLRVALAEHLATTEEPAPLLLDDVTVQCDAARTAAILGMLHKLADERQVVLFSQETQVRDWARAHLSGPDHALVELPEPL